MQQVAYIREGEYEQKWAAKGRVRGVRKAKCERKACEGKMNEQERHVSKLITPTNCCKPATNK